MNRCSARKFCLAVVLACIGCATAAEIPQGYIPLSNKRAGLVAAGPACSPIPALSGGFVFRDKLLTFAAALKIGFVIGNTSAGANTMVLVRDYVKGEECLATDQKTRLLYGEAVRTVITVSNYDASLKLTFPAIAADATAKGTSYQVDIETLGWSNSEATKLIATLAGKTLNVESFADYNSVESRLIAMTVDQATTHTVVKLGVVPGILQDADLSERVVTTFALQLVSDGRSCVEAKTKLKDPTAVATDAVSGLYTYLGGTCDSQPLGKAERDRANSLLNGYRLKY